MIETCSSLHTRDPYSKSSLLASFDHFSLFSVCKNLSRTQNQKKMAVSINIIVQWLLGIATTFATFLFTTHFKPLEHKLKDHSTFNPAGQTRQSSLQEPDYRSTFPPSRRAFSTKLKRIASKPLEARTHPNASSKQQDIDFTSYTSTATGFTSDDIHMIGDFPNYAELSGVPLPKPCFEFKIETALPRPYRPFRWVYHQTMGTCHGVVRFDSC